MLLTLLQSPTVTQAGYYSLFVWHYGGAGAFTATVQPSVFASRSIVVGVGVY